MNTGAKVLNKILRNQIQQYIRRTHITTKCNLSQQCKAGSILKKSINVIHCINSLKEKKDTYDHITWYRKSIWQQWTLSKLRIERSFPNLIHNIYKKATANIVFNGERWNASPLDWEQGKDVDSHNSYSAWFWKH